MKSFRNSPTYKDMFRIDEYIALSSSEINKPDSSPVRSVKNSFYENFGFEKNPFSDSLDTLFFYQSEKHEEALIKMLISVEHDISFGLIYGPSGTGKTMISQVILEHLSKQRFKPVLVPVSPSLSQTAFLCTVLSAFETKSNVRSVHDGIKQLEEVFLSSYQTGLKPVLLIDEAHFLSSQALHLLRTLSNFEAYHKKLVTCLLFAEERFIKRLANPSYCSLKNRIYLEIKLPALTEEECRNYIKYRLMAAGNDKGTFFNQEEIKGIFRSSHGIPRNINKECMKLMLEKYLKQNSLVPPLNN